MPKDFKPEVKCYCGNVVTLENKGDMYSWDGRCTKCPEYWQINLVNSTKEIFG